MVVVDLEVAEVAKPPKSVLGVFAKVVEGKVGTSLVGCSKRGLTASN